MKVSRSLFIWIFAVLAAVSFAFMPVVAGDHPWNEDESKGGTGNGGEPGNGGTQPDDPPIVGPDVGATFGSALFWWDLIRNRITSEDNTENTAVNTAGTQESRLFGSRSYR